jgi:predicted kinase
MEQGAQIALEEARMLVELALVHLEAGRVRLTVVSGLPATGKSTLAKLLERQWSKTRSCLLLSSDVLRDQLLPDHSDLPDGVDSGRYSPALRTDVYRAMFQQAESALQCGRDVILDATFADDWTHAAAEDLASHCHARLLVLRCEVPAAVAQQRLTSRVRGADTRSEADAAVYRHLAATGAVWPTAHPVDMSSDVERAWNQVAKLVG